MISVQRCASIRVEKLLVPDAPSVDRLPAPQFDRRSLVSVGRVT